MEVELGLSPWVLKGTAAPGVWSHILPVSSKAGGELGQEGSVLLGQDKPVFSKEVQNWVVSSYQKYLCWGVSKLLGAQWTWSGFPKCPMLVLSTQSPPKGPVLRKTETPSKCCGAADGSDHPFANSALALSCRPGSQRTASFGSASRRTATTRTPQPCTAAHTRGDSGMWLSTSEAKPSVAAAPVPGLSMSPHTSYPASGSPSSPSSPSPSPSLRKSSRHRNQRLPHPHLGKTLDPSSTA